jgi:hypothetical protein
MKGKPIMYKGTSLASIVGCRSRDWDFPCDGDNEIKEFAHWCIIYDYREQGRRQREQGRGVSAVRRLAEKAGTYVQLIAKCVQFFHWTVEWLRTCCVYYGKKYIQYYHGSPSFTRGKFGWSLCSTYFRFEWSRKIQELNSIKRLKKLRMEQLNILKHSHIWKWLHIAYFKLQTY